MHPIIKLIRPHHWIKNLFLLIPVFFAGAFFNSDKLAHLAAGVIAFSLVSGVIYIINDIKDVEFDKLHAEKKNRPLAAGEVTIRWAVAAAIVLFITAVVLCYFLPPHFRWIIFLYFILNVLYSYGLKQIPILDMVILSFGFILRILAGGVLGNVPISEWLIIMIFLLSLFLAIAKRRDDVLIFMNSGIVSRSSTTNYNLQFINSTLTMISGIIIVSYLIYTISPEVKTHMHSDYLYVTSIFVILGMMRYLQIIFVENDSGSPIKIIYTDRFIQITLFGWILTFFFLLYAPKI